MDLAWDFVPFWALFCYHKISKGYILLICLKIYLFYVILDITKENRTHNLSLLRALAAMKVCKTSYGY